MLSIEAGHVLLHQTRRRSAPQRQQAVVILGSDRTVQAVEAQRTHGGDGFEVGIEAHELRVVVQRYGGHQQIKAQYRAADLTAGLANSNRLLPDICWRGQAGQGVELRLKQACFLRPRGSKRTGSARWAVASST